MKPFNNRLTGWSTIAAGICALGITVSLMALSAIGGLGDFLGIVAAVLYVPMLIAISWIVMAKNKTIGYIVLFLGLLAALIDFIQSILFMSGVIPFEQSAALANTDRGLIGIGVFTFAFVNYRNPELKRLYIWLTFILGLVMIAPVTVLIVPTVIGILNVDIADRKTLARTVQVLGALGILLESAQYVLLKSGALPAEQAAYIHYAGAGAMAVALVLSLTLKHKDADLKLSYPWLVILLVWVVAQTIVGDLDAVFARLSQGGSLADENPAALVILFTAAPMYLLGWPIWLIWTGRLFLKGKLFLSQQHEAAPQSVQVT